MSVKSVVKAVFIRLAVFLVAVLLALVLAEVLLRITGYDPIFNPAGPRYMFIADDELGVRLRPEFEGTHRDAEFSVPVKINAMGFRDAEIGPKTDDVFRVLSLGDSFAFGYGVEADACYASVLEKLLNEHSTGRRFEVVNMGAPSYSMSQMATLLERNIDALKPDLVVTTLLIADDLRTNEGGELTERGGLVLPKAFAAEIDRNPQARFAVSGSEVALMIYKTRIEWEHDVDLSAPTEPPPGLPRPAGLPYLARKQSDKAKVEWATARRLLARIAKRTTDAGARYVLFHIPLPYMVDDGYWKESLAAHPDIDAERFNLRFASNKLKGMCQKLDIHFFDPALGSGTGLALSAADYFPGNLHFNVAGHAKIGAMLAHFLATEGLL